MQSCFSSWWTYLTVYPLGEESMAWLDKATNEGIIHRQGALKKDGQESSWSGGVRISVKVSYQ